MLCSLFKTLTVLIVAVFGLPALAKGDVIWLKGNSQPVIGQITSRSSEQIRISVFSNGSYSATQTISTSQVETLVVNIDPKRLESLDPNDPSGYREYAEELSTQTKDPSAIELATRLYLLAAANSRSEERHGALLGLLSLAQNENQKRRYEMLLRLNSPTIGNIAARNNDQAGLVFSKSDKQLMLDLVVALRQERSRVVSKLLKPEKNRESLRKWSDHCTLKELERIAAETRPTKVQLSKLLTVEMMIRQSSSNVKSARQDWSDLATQPASSVGMLPTLNNATKFDPAKSIYRKGIWVSASKK